MLQTRRKFFGFSCVKNHSDVELTSDAISETICSLCGVVCSEIISLPCTHRLCILCFNDVPQKADNSKLVCPVDEAVCDSEVVDFQNYDSKVLSNISAYCFNCSKGCNYIGPLSSIEHHHNYCKYEEVQCQLCESKVLRKYLISHVTSRCTDYAEELEHFLGSSTATEEKSFSRAETSMMLTEEFSDFAERLEAKFEQLRQEVKSNTDNSQKTLSNALNEVLEEIRKKESKGNSKFSCQECKNLKDKIFELQEDIKHVAAISVGLSGLQKEILREVAQISPQSLITEIKTLKSAVSESSQALQRTFNEKANNLTVTLGDVQKELYSLKQKLGPSSKNQLTPKPQGLSKSLESFTENGYATPELSELKNLVLNSVSLTGHDPIFRWKVVFSGRTKQNILQGNFLYSEEFFSHNKGYLLYLSVEGKAKGSDGLCSYLGVHLHAGRGPFDDSLEWPFRWDYTLKLVNIVIPEKTIEKSVKWKSLSRPRRDSCLGHPAQFKQHNTGYGFSQFVSVEELQSDGYLINDTFYVELLLDPNISKMQRILSDQKL